MGGGTQAGGRKLRKLHPDLRDQPEERRRGHYPQTSETTCSARGASAQRASHKNFGLVVDVSFAFFCYNCFDNTFKIADGEYFLTSF